MVEGQPDTNQPRMLAPTQVEAHVTRLAAVREGLRKFESDDGRAAECVEILSVAIKTLESEPFRTPTDDEVPDEAAPAEASEPQSKEYNRSEVAVSKNIVHSDKEDMSEHDWQTHTHKGFLTVDPMVHEHGVTEDGDRSSDPLPSAPGE